jgi:hypothetical protein
LVAAVTARRSVAARLGAALLVLVVAWLFAPAMGADPPLYDGIGFPDEPYRYVDRPAHAVQMPPPTPAAGTSARGAGGFAAVVAASAEQGPQILLILAAGQLTAAPACTTVTVLGQPAAPPAAAGDTWGNAYRVTLTCTAGASGPAALTGAPSTVPVPAAIQLRAPDATQPGPSIYYSADGRSWRKLPTLRVGNDIYQAALAGAGSYVLVHAPGGGLLGLDPVVWLVIGVLLALVVTILAIRLSRGRAARAGEDPDEQGADDEAELGEDGDSEDEGSNDNGS